MHGRFQRRTACVRSPRLKAAAWTSIRLPWLPGKGDTELDDSKQIVSVSARERRKVLWSCQMAVRSWAAPRSAGGSTTVTRYPLEEDMQWLWNWGGDCFGYRDGDDLWTHDGRHVGRFARDAVHGPDGRYLGEVQDERLITRRSDRGRLEAGFVPYARRAPYARYAPYVGYAMYAGYEDFPKAEEL